MLFFTFIVYTPSLALHYKEVYPGSLWHCTKRKKKYSPKKEFKKDGVVIVK